MNNQYSNFGEIHEQPLDIKALLFKFLSYWYLFVITIVLALLIAFLFNKYTLPVYKVKTTVLIKDERGGMSDAQSLLGLGNITNTQKLQNQISILKSRTLISRTLKTLDYSTSYFKEDNFITTEVYKESPFKVIPDSSDLLPVGNIKFYVSNISENSFQLDVEGFDVEMYDFKKFTDTDKKIGILKYSGKHTFGEVINNPNFNFHLEKTEKFNAKSTSNQKYYFVFDIT